jgi:hypothetical protein
MDSSNCLALQSWVIVQVFPYLWCWVWLVLRVECWSSIHHDARWPWWWSMLWFEQSLEWWGRLWLSRFVVSQYAKDWVLRIDTPGQQVSPRVWYGMACLLIRVAVGSVPYSDEWEISVVTCLGSHGARGAMVPCTTLAKPRVRPIVNLCNDM